MPPYTNQGLYGQLAMPKQDVNFMGQPINYSATPQLNNFNATTNQMAAQNGLYGQYTNNVNPQSQYNLGDYMGLTQSGVNILGGIGGLYGMYKQNQLADESMKMAREDQAARRRAEAQYNQFRTDTKSAFA